MEFKNAIILTGEIKRTKDGEEKEKKVTLKDKFRIKAINDATRKKITMYNKVQTNYIVHMTSNLSRIEYEIAKDEQLKALFSSNDLRLDDTHSLRDGFMLIFNNKKIVIVCKYAQKGYRQYTILLNNVKVFDKELESPVPMAWEYRTYDEDETEED